MYYISTTMYISITTILIQNMDKHSLHSLHDCVQYILYANGGGALITNCWQIQEHKTLIVRNELIQCPDTSVVTVPEKYRKPSFKVTTETLTVSNS